MESYARFKANVSSFAVVNERAEQHIKLVQDFIDQTHDEDSLQDTLQVCKENRKKITKDVKKQILFCES